MEELKTIKECCEKIKSEVEILEYCLKSEIDGHLKNINQITDRILELNKEKEDVKEPEFKSEYLVFTKPFFLNEQLVVEKFGLEQTFKNERTTIYDGDDVRFCFDKKIIRVTLYNGDNSKLKREIKDYFYEKQWKKK